MTGTRGSEIVAECVQLVMDKEPIKKQEISEEKELIQEQILRIRSKKKPS